MKIDHTDESGNLDLQTGFLQLMPELKGWFSGMVADRALVDDLVQETFLTVFRKQDTFEVGTNFRAWVFAIARFKLLNVSRNPANSEVCLSESVLDAVLHDESPAQSWDQRLEFLNRCLKKLAPRAREVIELRYFSDLDPPEVADSINWSTGSVNVALTRARQVLAQCVQAEIDHLEQQSPGKS